MNADARGNGADIGNVDRIMQAIRVSRSLISQSAHVGSPIACIFVDCLGDGAYLSNVCVARIEMNLLRFEESDDGPR